MDRSWTDLGNKKCIFNQQTVKCWTARACLRSDQTSCVSALTCQRLWLSSQVSNYWSPKWIVDWKRPALSYLPWVHCSPLLNPSPHHEPLVVRFQWCLAQKRVSPSSLSRWYPIIRWHLLLVLVLYSYINDINGCFLCFFQWFPIVSTNFHRFLGRTSTASSCARKQPGRCSTGKWTPWIRSRPALSMWPWPPTGTSKGVKDGWLNVSIFFMGDLQV